MSEFDLISWIRARVGVDGEGVALGIGDDAAVLQVPAGHELVTSTDIFNFGIHFDDQFQAADAGYKSLAVNLSDLAAMGAVPRWVLLGFTSPTYEEEWIKQFLGGFLQLAGQFSVSLVGGDTSAGALGASVTVMGLCEQGHALTRSGANIGDLIVVSGEPGVASFARTSLGQGASVSDEDKQKLLRPMPRVGLGQSLVGYASACIDVSDGLLADLGHLAQSSGCGVDLELDCLPVAPSLVGIDRSLRYQHQLTGGDDYELCFTAPVGSERQLRSLEREHATPLTVIGKTVSKAGVRCFDENGKEHVIERSGYEHFSVPTSVRID